MFEIYLAHEVHVLLHLGTVYDNQLCVCIYMLVCCVYRYPGAPQTWPHWKIG